MRDAWDALGCPSSSVLWVPWVRRRPSCPWREFSAWGVGAVLQSSTPLGA